MVIFGVSIALFPHWLEGHIPVLKSKSGYFSAILLAASGLYLLSNWAWRHPRLAIGPRGVSVRRVFHNDFVAWENVAEFQVEPRVHGLQVGDYTVVADKRSGGRFSIWLGPFDVNAHALMMELDETRRHALEK